MSEVKMSIKEYNEMRDELLLYKRVLSNLLRPEFTPWDVQWYQENPSSSLQAKSRSLREMDNEVKDFIKSFVEKNFDNMMRDLPENIDIGEIDLESFYVNILSIRHSDKNEVVETVEPLNDLA